MIGLRSDRIVMRGIIGMLELYLPIEVYLAGGIGDLVSWFGGYSKGEVADLRRGRL